MPTLIISVKTYWQICITKSIVSRITIKAGSISKCYYKRTVVNGNRFFFLRSSDWMTIVRHANTDEGSNNGTSRENSRRNPESRLSPKVGEYQPNMLVAFAIVALSTFQSVGSYC